MLTHFQPVETKLSNQKLSITYFIFHSEIALQPSSYVAKGLQQKCLQQTWSWQKQLMVKIPGTVLSMSAPSPLTYNSLLMCLSPSLLTETLENWTMSHYQSSAQESCLTEAFCKRYGVSNSLQNWLTDTAFILSPSSRGEGTKVRNLQELTLKSLLSSLHFHSYVHVHDYFEIESFPF